MQPSSAMKENVGRIDRAIRAVVGPALMVLGYTVLEGRRGRAQGLAAIVVGTGIVESAITGVCPVNKLLGLDTRSALERERDERDVRARVREADAVAAFASTPAPGTAAAVPPTAIIEERPS